MKAVLISIQPKWCEKICSGKKTIEVRKTKPTLETPFKCYIYCTQGKFKDLGVIGETMYQKRMKVIGEFMCYKIDDFPYDDHIGFPTPQYEGDPSYYDCGAGYWITCDELNKACLTQDELMDYGRRDTLYGWHISDLIVYDKPKEIGEFSRYVFHRRIPWLKAPQSWGYCFEKLDPKLIGKTIQVKKWRYEE